MPKEVSEYSREKRIQAQLIHYTETHVLPLNIDFGDCAMVHTNAMHRHKRQSKRKGPMQVIEAKNCLMFMLKDLKSADTHSTVTN